MPPACRRTLFCSKSRRRRSTPGSTIPASAGGASSQVGDTLLVCDVGGGTTDLSLVGVAEENGELVLRRLAVGNHLLVGGDNMDLALGPLCRGQVRGEGVQLDPWQSVSLWHSCRAAKEELLAGDGAKKKHTITVAGRGSRLIGKSKSVEIEREEAIGLLRDGFFPRSAITDRPARQRASGFQEIGLPFEADTGITRHLAAFLHSHGDGGQPARPTHVLFNGGVFKAAGLQERVLEVLGEWFARDDVSRSEKGKSARQIKALLDKPAVAPATGPQRLAGAHDLDHAVARGAAVYGWSKVRGGVRIRGGTARSYYVGIESAGLAIPGAARPLRALCVVPIGMEEGTETDVAVGRDRPGRGRTRAFSLLQQLDAQGRQAGGFDPVVVARGHRRERFTGSNVAGRRIGSRRLRARKFPQQNHGAWHVRAMVRSNERRPAVETGVQRAG